MNKLLIICGPTATGKTDFGIYLTKKYNGEIVSADSRQVYKGMDIGTGKDIDKNKELRIKDKKFNVGFRLKDGIPIWLIDVVEPDYRFNVGEYAFLAKKVINDIWLRNKLPIVIGGTGLYIRALVEPLADINVPPNIVLRKELEKLEREKLINYLIKMDAEQWQRMNQSDKFNPRRLIRKIEIIRQKQNISVKQNNNQQLKINKLLLIGLKTSIDLLNNKIDQRVEERVKEGVEEEIKSLFKKGYSFENSVLGVTIGYKEWKPYFEKVASKEEVINRWKYSEHAYMRRQLTWFKKDKRIVWFDTTEKDNLNKIEETVRRWYTSNNNANEN